MSGLPFSCEEARAIVELAFLPLRCETPADTDDASFAIRVYGPDDRPVLSVAHVARSQYESPLRLAGVIEQARLELSKDGFALEPWSMPGQSGAGSAAVVGS
jgi:hypothetical protein